MLQYWDALQNALIDRSPQELIGAIAVAVILSLAVTGLYNLGRRKIQDGVLLMTVLVLLACVTSMTLTAGFFTRRRAASLHRTGPAHGAHAQPWPEPDRVFLLAQWVFERADRDRDGFLTHDEAAAAASRIVQDGNPSGVGSLNVAGLAQVLRANFVTPPPTFMPGPPSVPFGPPQPPRAPGEPRDREHGPYNETNSGEPKTSPGNTAGAVQD